jgi:hypothetical protein
MEKRLHSYLNHHPPKANSGILVTEDGEAKVSGIIPRPA